jgi:carbamoyltransferase
MPFAPSILDKYYKYYFNDKFPSIYMQKAQKINNEKIFIPSAIHVDNTCRVHLVDKKISKFFWDIINSFKKITGIPMLLNTSFNRHGIATIGHPRQAVEHLMEDCFDILYINHFKITKKNMKISNKIKMSLIDEKKLLRSENQQWLKKNKDIITDKAYKNFKKNLKI